MSDRYSFPAYPNGWFRVAYSSELEIGDVAPLHYFGQDLVLFRDEEGTAHVLDAHCRHLGAHLGYGGRVEGDGIRCPFHAWKWNGAGICTDIPYAKRIPAGAKIRTWPSVEKNGLVMVHHHIEGAAPTFEVPDLPQVGADGWTPLEIRRWKVRSRWLDMNENAVDQVHFHYVHGTVTTPQTHVEQDGHILRCKSKMTLKTPRGDAPGAINTTDFGPGFQTVDLTGIIETLMINTSTPIDDEYTDVSFSYTINAKGNEQKAHGVGAAIIRDLEKQFEEDRPIWENKKYYAQPMLCDGDGKFGAYRRWMSQFFSAKGNDRQQPPAAKDR